MSRRTWLKQLAGLPLTTAAGVSSWTSGGDGEGAGYTFSHRGATGDSLNDSVILWTRMDDALTLDALEVGAREGV